MAKPQHRSKCSRCSDVLPRIIRGPGVHKAVYTLARRICTFVTNSGTLSQNVGSKKEQYLFESSFLMRQTSAVNPTVLHFTLDWPRSFELWHLFQKGILKSGIKVALK